MLKFHLKKECLDFTSGWETLEKQMVEDDLPKEDLLQKVLQVNFQDHFDTLIKTISKDEAEG